MNNILTRRAAVTAMMAVAATPALATTATAVDRSLPSDWLQLIADYHRAQAKAAVAGNVHAAAENAYFAQRKPEPVKMQRPSPITEDMTIAQIKAMLVELFGCDDAEWREWRADANTAHARIVDPANDAWTAALRDESAAMRAIQAYPSTSPAMVVEKLRLLAEHLGNDLGGDPDDLVGVIADARRLSTMEG